MALPVGALARKPEVLDFAEAAAVGVNFVVGWLGAIETAHIAAGETIAVAEKKVRGRVVIQP
ncbi:hypothetical protein ACFOY2_40240 [Nonomuraea purpurea]|uniref:Uncharacterized protein n=1 Tax=Nonomuraea purpurea TaxID=1849276 RepID=A0ABV8GMW4_9ACTN